jgi:hypothetical protein
MKEYYSGNFIFGLADLASLSKVKIADILQGEEYVFETTDLQAEMQKTITTPDSPVVFPVCKMQNKFYNRYKNGAFLLPRTVDDAGYPMPFLKLQAIFNLLIKRLGYHLQNPNWHLVSNRNPEFAQKAAQVAKVILFNNKILAFGQTVTQGEPVDVLDNDGNYLYQVAGEITVTNVINGNLFYADYVPDMTVADFLKSVKNLFCLHYEIDNKKKEFTVHFITEILNSDQAVDWTHKASPLHKVAPCALLDMNVNFQFENWKEDPLFSFIENPWETSKLNFKGDVETAAELPTIGITQDEIRYVRSEKKYYQAALASNVFSFWADIPYQYVYNDYYLQVSNNSNTSNVKNISTQFAPIQSNRYWKFRNEKGRLELYKPPTGVAQVKCPIDFNQVWLRPAYFIFKDSKVYRNQTQHMVVQDMLLAANGQSIVPASLLSLDFKAKEELAYTRVSDGGFIIPDTGFAGYYYNKTQKPPAKLLLYQGLQTALVNRLDYNDTPIPNQIPPDDSSVFYPFASEDMYDNYGQRINDFALYWHGKYGLVNSFWKEFLSNQRLSRIFEVSLSLNLTDLQNLQNSRKIRIREALFILDSLETKIGENIAFCTAKLIKVGGEINTALQIPTTGNIVLELQGACLQTNPNYVILNSSNVQVATITNRQTVYNLPAGTYTVRGTGTNATVFAYAVVVGGQTTLVRLDNCPLPDVVKFAYQIGYFGIQNSILGEVLQDSAGIGIASKSFAEHIPAISGGTPVSRNLGDLISNDPYYLVSNYVWNNGLTTVRRNWGKAMRALLVIDNNGFSSVDNNLQISIRLVSFYTTTQDNVRYGIVITYENNSQETITVTVPNTQATTITINHTLLMFGRAKFEVTAQTKEDDTWQETNFVSAYVRIWI